MDWVDEMELTSRVEERQANALQSYEGDPFLLEEHVAQEDSYREGGYGKRQISELLQNAVDAVASDGGNGRIEFRLAGGALYCANSGMAFSAAGVDAVTHAFISRKRDDEIGRFGLGFKSVLGVTDHPQIFSRSVCFEFGSPDVRELFEGMKAAGGRLPILRVPMVVDPQAAMAEDDNLAELLQWATTVVKLPLRREGARLRAELTTDFSMESLLFMTAVREFVVSATDAEGGLAIHRYGREVIEEDRTVRLTASDGTSTTWFYAERDYHPSDAVRAALPETQRRKHMKVSYAVNPERRRDTGRLWAWFPLHDETTAGGLFNAPWQINDDRTSLIRQSALNRELLDVAADLFLDVAVRASNAQDPAAHLDLFPARGDEARSDADRVLSATIPARAAQRPMVPDRTGRLVAPDEITAAVDLASEITRAQCAEWNRFAERDNVPHEACYTTPQRKLRLRSLLGGASGKRSNREVAVSTWLEELVKPRTNEVVSAALALATAIQNGGRVDRSDLVAAKIVPLVGGGWADLKSQSGVLIPRPGVATPSGVGTVDTGLLTPEDLAQLREFGFRDISADEVVRALGGSLTRASSESDWDRFWRAAAEATPPSVVAVIGQLRERTIMPRVFTRASRWSEADEVLLDDAIGANLADRHPDRARHPNDTALRAAGCLGVRVRNA